MKDVADNDEILIAYLLGELSEDEQEGIEQRYLGDPAFYEQLLSVEDDLIDQYAEDALSAARRLSFETHFLRSPERQTRVGFAHAWRAYVSRHTKTATPVSLATHKAPAAVSVWARLPLSLRIAAAVALILVTGLLSFEVVTLRNQVQRAESERAELEQSQRELQRLIDEEKRVNQELSAQLDRERAAKLPDQPQPTLRSGIVTFFLTSGSVRGTGGSAKYVIPRDSRQVNLQLSFKDDDENQSYAVTINTVEGSESWRKDGLTATSRSGAKMVAVLVPASLFSSNDYIVNLSKSGTTGRIARYVFNVTRR